MNILTQRFFEQIQSRIAPIQRWTLDWTGLGWTLCLCAIIIIQFGINKFACNFFLCSHFLCEFVKHKSQFWCKLTRLHINTYQMYSACACCCALFWIYHSTTWICTITTTIPVSCKQKIKRRRRSRRATKSNCIVIKTGRQHINSSVLQSNNSVK